MMRKIGVFLSSKNYTVRSGFDYLYPDKLGDILDELKNQSHDVATFRHPHEMSWLSRRSLPHAKLLFLRSLGSLPRALFPSKDFTPSNLVSLVKQAWTKARISSATWALRKYEVGVVIGIGLDHTVLAACQELDLTTIEVQHGVISSDARELISQGRTADWFACWTDWDVCQSEEKGMSAIKIGPPSPPSDLYLARRGVTITPRVLIPLQHSIESPSVLGLLGTSLYSEILSFMKRGQIQVTFRFHPVTGWMRRFVFRLFVSFSKKVTFENPRRKSLFEGLGACDAVVTQSSSTWIEAVQLGKPTLIWESSAYAQALEQRIVGQPGKLYSSQELSLWLQEASRGTFTQGTSQRDLHALIRLIVNKL